MFDALLKKIIPKPNTGTNIIQKDGSEFLKTHSDNKHIDPVISTGEVEEELSEILLDVNEDDTCTPTKDMRIDYNKNVSHFAKIVISAISEVVGEEPIVTGYSKSQGFVGIRPLNGSYSKKKRDIAEAVKIALLKEDIEVFKVKVEDNQDRLYLGSYIIDIDLVKEEI